MALDQSHEIETKVNCKGCGRSFEENVILRHICNHFNVSCKESYSETEITSFKEKAKSRKKLTNKEWKKNNLEAISAHNHKWYSNHSQDYNNQRRNQYKEKNKSVQRAKKYQEDKKKDQELLHKLAVERSKKDLEDYLVWMVEDQIKVHLSHIEGGFTSKLCNYERRQINYLKNYGVDVHNEQKLDIVLNSFQERIISWKTELSKTVELIKKEMGPRENWIYEDRLFDQRFITVMLLNVEHYIEHEARLLKYQAKDTYEKIAEEVGLILKEEECASLKSLNTTSREKCMERINNYPKYRDEIICSYKTKSFTGEHFSLENIIQNQHSSKSETKASKDEIPSTSQTKDVTNADNDQDKIPSKKPPSKNDNKLRKRKNIDFTVEDLEDEADNDNEFICNARASISRIMPKLEI